MNNLDLLQRIIDHVVQISTNAAINGHPIKNIVWVPPSSPTQDEIGTFVVYDKPLN
jgi:hypothetical protein